MLPGCSSPTTIFAPSTTPRPASRREGARPKKACREDRSARSRRRRPLPGFALRQRGLAVSGESRQQAEGSRAGRYALAGPSPESPEGRDQVDDQGVLEQSATMREVTCF